MKRMEGNRLPKRSMQYRSQETRNVGIPEGSAVRLGSGSGGLDLGTTEKEGDVPTYFNLATF
jgi:hypothetical protein